MYPYPYTSHIKIPYYYYYCRWMTKMRWTKWMKWEMMWFCVHLLLVNNNVYAYICLYKHHHNNNKNGIILFMNRERKTSWGWGDIRGETHICSIYAHKCSFYTIFIVWHIFSFTNFLIDFCFRCLNLIFNLKNLRGVNFFFANA